MRSGRLRHFIKVVSPSDELDDYGKPKRNYIKVFDAKASVIVLSGSEMLKAGVDLTKEYISILMRYDERLRYDHEILHRTNQYEVESIKPDDKNFQMVVVAVRDIKDG